MDTNAGKKEHFSYNKLFKLLIDKGIKKKASANWMKSVRPLLTKFGHGGNTNTEVLCKIYCALDCDVGDIMELVRE